MLNLIYLTVITFYPSLTNEYWDIEMTSAFISKDCDPQSKSKGCND